MATTTKLMDTELAKLFARFDINKDDRIDEKEFGMLLRTLGKDISDANVSAFFSVIDTSGDGKVDLDEFVNWWLDHSSV